MFQSLRPTLRNALWRNLWRLHTVNRRLCVVKNCFTPTNRKVIVYISKTTILKKIHLCVQSFWFIWNWWKGRGIAGSIHAIAPIVDGHCQSMLHSSWDDIFNITPVLKAGIISTCSVQLRVIRLFLNVEHLMPSEWMFDDTLYCENSRKRYILFDTASSKGKR
jgi:hypothetical protein